MNEQQVQQLLEQGVEAHRANRLHEAEITYRKILASHPNHAQAMNMLGVIAMQVGRNTQAIEIFNRSLQLDVSNAECWCHLSVALAAEKRLDDAVAACRRALSLRPDFPEALNNLAASLKNLGKPEESMIACRKSLALKPDYADAWCNLGALLIEARKFEEGVAACRKTLEYLPDSCLALCNLGVGLTELRQIDRAVGVLRRAVQLYPQFSDAHYNLANALYYARQQDEAITEFRKAIALRPEMPDAHWNLGLALLRGGELREGFAEYEWRWKAKKVRPLGEKSSRPAWDGRDLQNKRILFYAEQGFGDFIQFIRYLPLVAQRGGKILLVCRPELTRLVKSLEYVDKLIVEGEPYPDFDTHYALTSLPHIFGTTLETIPGPWPYLSADPELIERWKLRVPNDGRLKVGLVWAGSPHHAEDAERSIPLSMLSPLGKISGAWFCSLQKGAAAAQVHESSDLELTDFSAEIQDFADLAALIANLDLVISVDTAAVHLAGAMGKPVWMLLKYVPDWRWMLERGDSPWYPSLRIFRQNKRGDWQTPIDEVTRALAERSAWNEQQIRQLYDEAVQAHRAGRLHDAEMIYRRILAANPNHVESLDLLGVLAVQVGRNQNAADLFSLAARLQPGNAEIHLHLGMTLLTLNRTEEATASLRQALALRPQYPEALNYMSIAFKTLGKREQSIAFSRQSLALKPDYAEAWCGLGGSLIDDRQYDEGIAACRCAIELKPNYGNAICNLGVGLTEQMNFAEAVPICRRAVELLPDAPEAHYNLANILRETRQMDEAIREYRRAIELRPDLPDAHWNLSLALLRCGQLAEGFAEYEWRWKAKRLTPSFEKLRQSVWDGSDLNGRRILLYAEQGFGDCIHLVRYIPQIAQRGGKIILGCQAELERLLRRLPHIQQLVIPGQPLPDCDVVAELPSLPYLLKTTLENIPCEIPYLSADLQWIETWKSRVPQDGRLKVGLVWAGSPQHTRDKLRSIPLSMFAPLGQIENVWLCSLQKGDHAIDAKNPPSGMKLVDFAAQIEDFADAAGLVANLDLVIAVDTAAVHLAGAMGKAVWVLIPYSPDWRWLLDRDDSPWYPTMRLFRQEAVFDWEEPIGRVAEALRALAVGRWPGLKV